MTTNELQLIENLRAKLNEQKELVRIWKKEFEGNRKELLEYLGNKHTVMKPAERMRDFMKHYKGYVEQNAVLQDIRRKHKKLCNFDNLEQHFAKPTDPKSLAPIIDRSYPRHINTAGNRALLDVLFEQDDAYRGYYYTLLKREEHLKELNKMDVTLLKNLATRATEKAKVTNECFVILNKAISDYNQIINENSAFISQNKQYFSDITMLKPVSDQFRISDEYQALYEYAHKEKFLEKFPAPIQDKIM